jgi:hypothetical protein
MSATPLVATFLFMIASQSGDLFDHRAGLWSLPAVGETLRWVEIHNVEEARRSGVFHIQVLSRRRADPAWKVQSVAAHMAITVAALQRSVVSRLSTGSVYPEQFDEAYREWERARRAGTAAPVCDTTVDRCLPARE